MGHEETFVSLSESLLNSLSYILGGAFIWIFPTAGFLGSYILMFSRRWFSYTPFASCWMRPRPFSSYSKSITGHSALLAFVLLPFSANEVIPEFLTLTWLGQTFPVGIFTVSSVGWEWPTSFITVKSDESLSEDYSLTPLPVILVLNLTHTLSLDCLDVHVPLPVPTNLAESDHCLLRNVSNTSSKTKK